jgi:CBS domain-containing protein
MQLRMMMSARSLTHYNIGALPVVENGNICGMLTDRDIVTRCLAADRDPNKTTVEQIMTRDIRGTRPDMEASVAANLMGKLQVRRLPVLEDGKLCGMVSLGDLARREESVMDAADALMGISSNLLG